MSILPGFLGGREEMLKKLQEEQANPSSRDEKGRFAKGNKGGPGNPFGRRVGQLRKAVLEAVQEEDVRDILRAMVIKAKEGDVAAAKVVLGYAVGKPTETVDPDRLEVEEWQLHQARSVKPEQAEKVLGSLPAEHANFFVNLMWPLLMGMQVEKAMAEKKGQKESADRPSANGPSTNGPSTNGQMNPEPLPNGNGQGTGGGKVREKGMKVGQNEDSWLTGDLCGEKKSAKLQGEEGSADPSVILPPKV
jgi:hypothetical protein